MTCWINIIIQKNTFISYYFIYWRKKKHGVCWEITMWLTHNIMITFFLWHGLIIKYAHISYNYNFDGKPDTMPLDECE